MGESDAEQPESARRLVHNYRSRTDENEAKRADELCRKRSELPTHKYSPVVTD